MFLKDDDINILGTKGIHTIEDLGDYSGDDNLVLELQFLVKERLEKLKHKLKLIKDSPVLAEGLIQTSVDEPIPQLSKNSSGKSLKQVNQNTDEKLHSTRSENSFRLKEKTIEAIANLCEKYRSQTENHPKTLLECVLNVIVQDVLQMDNDFEELDLSIIFQETAELSGIPSSIGFIYSLENIDNQWKKNEELQSTILDRHLQQLQVTAESFVYNELFSRLLERKINRERQRKRIS